MLIIYLVEIDDSSLTYPVYLPIDYYSDSQKSITRTYAVGFEERYTASLNYLSDVMQEGFESTGGNTNLVEACSRTGNL